MFRNIWLLLKHAISFWGKALHPEFSRFIISENISKHKCYLFSINETNVHNTLPPKWYLNESRAMKVAENDEVLDHTLVCLYLVVYLDAYLLFIDNASTILKDDHKFTKFPESSNHYVKRLNRKLLVQITTNRRILSLLHFCTFN